MKTPNTWSICTHSIDPQQLRIFLHPHHRPTHFLSHNNGSSNFISSAFLNRDLIKDHNIKFLRNTDHSRKTFLLRPPPVSQAPKEGRHAKNRPLSSQARAIHFGYTMRSSKKILRLQNQKRTSWHKKKKGKKLMMNLMRYS